MTRIGEKKVRIRPTVCFDTTPLIWGIREDSSREDEHMIERAKKYVGYLESHRYSIMVPVPVVSEYLVGATETQWREAELLRRGYEIPVLDLPSAMLAAQLQRGGLVDAIHDEFGTSKQSIRIDAFIIAIAIRNGASRIVTANVREFTTLARGQILVGEVPILEPRTEQERETREQQSFLEPEKETPS